jgi:hypothetical protein
MDKIIRMRPTADVAGAEYLAKAMAKWPAAIQHRTPRRGTRAQPTAVTAGIEHRASVRQHRWPELLTWRCAT